MNWQYVEANWAAALAVNGLCFPSSEQSNVSQVFAASDFVAQQSIRHPAVLINLIELGLLKRPRNVDEIFNELEIALLDCNDDEALMKAMRLFRNREMIRIIWRDIIGAADLDETLRELSVLAESCIQQALSQLSQWAKAKDGIPCNAAGQEQSLLVVGMGKLGASELNLSSDIDLIFCYAEQGQTNGRRALANETYFTRLAQRLINVLSKLTKEGFVFRVDMRLRPFGDSGPLVVSFGAMEQYYHSQAREWERYAMVKAHILTGSNDDKAVLKNMLKAFVFRRYIDFGVIDSIAEMKRLIERELRQKGLAENIKLGMGGIREIEFIGQAFQLVRGGRDHELQARSIQQVLSLLQKKSLLPQNAVEALQVAYVFLRRTENRLQAWRDEQTHVLPNDSLSQKRLAIAMGFENWDAFYEVLVRHRQQVHFQFAQVFTASQAELAATDSLLSNVWLFDQIDTEVEALLRAAGFVNPRDVLQKVKTFRETSIVRLLSAPARSKLDGLMPLVLEAASVFDNADIVLQRFFSLIEAIVRRTAYLDLLLSNPLALSRLLHLLSESIWIGSQLARQPILLDELLDSRRLYAPMHSDDLVVELSLLLESVEQGDQEQEMERLRQFSLGNRLRVAAADITGAIPLMVVSGYLTEIAETILQQVQRSAWRDMAARYGHPVFEDERDGLAVIAYGKLGGVELGYGSDLDLVFLHENAYLSAMTNGDRAIANDVFYSRVAQRMIHMLNTRTPSGQLYDIDMRLRPNGSSGMLVSSVKAFEYYQTKEAWTWEHQALVRARAVSGDVDVIAEFERVRKVVLTQKRDVISLGKDVWEMRLKMAEKLDTSNATVFDLKHGAGGLVDIEFLVQYAVLRWSYDYPELTEWTDNARLLELLEELNLLKDGAAETLFQVYRIFREISHRNALQEEKALVEQTQFTQERARVRENWRKILLD